MLTFKQFTQKVKPKKYTPKDTEFGVGKRKQKLEEAKNYWNQEDSKLDKIGINKDHNEVHSAHQPTLEKTHVKAIKKYSTDSTVNKAAVAHYNGTISKMNVGHVNHWKDLNSVFDKNGLTRSGDHFHTGLGFNPVSGNHHEDEHGNIQIMNPGITSWSTDHNIASEFAKSVSNEPKYADQHSIPYKSKHVFHYEGKKGDKLTSVTAHSHYNNEEQEFIGKPNSLFTIDPKPIHIEHDQKNRELSTPIVHWRVKKIEHPGKDHPAYYHPENHGEV